MSSADEHALRAATAVHIVCSVYNGKEYLAEFVQSLQSQTVSNWLLWVRDDGSRDGSVDLLKQLVEQDERVRLASGPAGNLGVVLSFSAVLEMIPAEARYIMFADQDDVWLPTKIEYTLKAMLLGEQHSAGPLLVHTDMVVVDAALNRLDESFWNLARINPEANSLHRLFARNIVTGATMMMNQALRVRVGRIPAEAAMHDWWMACVASAFGNIIAVTTPTMLYRQHERNTIGAHQPGSSALAADVPRAAVRALRRTTRVRSDIAAAARQARAFLACFNGALGEADREFLSAYAQIPEQHFLRRKLNIARLHLQREDGLLKNAGLLLRA